MDPIHPDGAVTPDDCPFVPLWDHVLAEFCQINEGSIYLPDNAETPLNFGRVLKVGPGRPREIQGDTIPVPEIQPGDVICFVAIAHHLGPVPFTWQGHALILVRARDVAAVRRDIPWEAAPSPEAAADDAGTDLASLTADEPETASSEA